MCKQRNTYIDIAKGIGIIMVLGLHTGFHFEWMTPFEMPLFFFLSGVLFNEKIPFKLFVGKKTNRINDEFCYTYGRLVFAMSLGNSDCKLFYSQINQT